jgi:hypothetical protein
MAAAGRVHVNPVDKLLDMNVAIAALHAVAETRTLCCRPSMLLMRPCMDYYHVRLLNVFDSRLPTICLRLRRYAHAMPMLCPRLCHTSAP